MKYSIMLPACNGAKYIRSAIDSVLSQNFSDYELIVSDDNSSDDSKVILTNLSHPNLKVYFPEQGMSMSEHWEWVLYKAKGEWQIFLGQDDGLQPYFFDYAEKITAIANKHNLRAIMSERAYYFWEGCETVYGDAAVQYSAIPRTQILNFKTEALKALLGFQNYFELPEMYTTSLFHRSILEECKNKQQGKIFTAHPQDANLGAIACSLERKYLKTFIPLGWVGSSPKSAGIAISHEKKDNLSRELENLRNDYLSKINNSKISYRSDLGDFSFGFTSAYFWQAFAQTPNLRNPKINKFLESNFFKGAVLGGMKKVVFKSEQKEKIEQFWQIAEKNNCSKTAVWLWSFVLGILWNSLRFWLRVENKFYSIVYGKKAFFIKQSEFNEKTMKYASEMSLKCYREMFMPN